MQAIVNRCYKNGPFVNYTAMIVWPTMPEINLDKYFYLWWITTSYFVYVNDTTKAKFIKY